MRLSVLRLLAGLAVPVLSLAPAHAEEVVVFAAASMKTALDDFAAKWETETGNTVTISYAGSSQLARQIMQGAPADIFISANSGWMDEVEKSGLVKDGRRRDLLGNSLVLIAHGRDAGQVDIAGDFDLAGLLGEGKLAMALVDSVPAGQYGKAALEALGIWGQVAPSVAQADNVRAALRLVSVGEAPYGIVYATDAAADENVTIAGTFPENTHPPIIYPAALLRGADAAADEAFYQALSGEAARASFEAQGFRMLD
ncbi:molybdate ABC transporter substrate-binding protein [Pseudohoeflea suaedae]|uniref:Molybdate ABC transporter substrate-binding protein n=1 Tax=Pseudohoeflea suaedae TaxID=877384 RepID=A0A4R5PK33_9HYPH|nr:molybdate ABC transporter substrate-binding protein [Pseudohoeflea suaedae]TDH35976.1 molybdate ABC transporter substrate-binding protein [Pseudohoeflea suaedae]